MADAEVSIISKHMVRPSPRPNEERKEIIFLTPSDLRMLPVHYIQKGLLFHKPHNQSIDLIVSSLLSSFSQALDLFYPLAGRFRTARHHDDDSISISLHCTDEGAEFIHASAPTVRISDILAPGFYIPTIVHFLFPLNGIFDNDGHAEPLIGVQVTELADGIFVACSLNHTAADGNSFWRFFNTWSDVCRNGVGNNKKGAVESSSVFERWFPDSVTPPVRLPFADHRQLMRVSELPPVRECMLHFSSTNVKKLKAMANEEMDRSSSCCSKISSLQALIAHVWRSVGRARALKPEENTSYFLSVGFRSRLNPPLPETYLGNSIIGVPVEALAGEIESKGLGWTAWQLNRAIASVDEAAVCDWFETWCKSPSFVCIDMFTSTALAISSSPRFDVYGSDFGWGRPVAVRSGPGNKVDGKMTVYTGAEEGSIDLEICLRAKVLSSLLQDNEFMEVVD